MDRIKNIFATNKIDDLIEKSETQDLENQSLRSKQDVVFNMVSDLEKRTKFPDNMAMYAGPDPKTIFPYGSTAEDLFYFGGMTFDKYNIKNKPQYYPVYYADYLSAFPNVKDFDIIRFVLFGGTIKDDNTVIARSPDVKIYNWPTFPYWKASDYWMVWHSDKITELTGIKYHTNKHIEWFIDNNQQIMLELYKKYPGKYEDPTMIEIGTITQTNNNVLNSDWAKKMAIGGTIPLLFPKVYNTNPYWKKMLEIFVSNTNHYNTTMSDSKYIINLLPSV